MKYVAFLDILGFKEHLKKLNQHQAEKFIGKFSKLIYQEWEDAEIKRLKGYIVSDSFIIYTEDTKPESLAELLSFIDRVCKKEFSENSVLIRGGIAKGEFERMPAAELQNLKKGLIVGQAYVDAYLLEGVAKTTGIIFKENIYEDILNIPMGDENITQTTVKNNGVKEQIYILRYLTLDFLLDEKNLVKYIQLAKQSNWLPHYYNTLYLAMKNETNEKKINQAFLNILNCICEGKPGENYNALDIFIEHAFNENIIVYFQKRFLRFLRSNIFR